MYRTATEAAINIYLREIGNRLEKSADIAKAATACAAAGSVDKAVEIALDIEQLTYEASRLLDAASLLNRLSRNE